MGPLLALVLLLHTLPLALGLHSNEIPPPPREGTAPMMPTSDALLTDWEGQHWVSLDAEQDKVALSWTADQEYITFQVRRRV